MVHTSRFYLFYFFGPPSPPTATPKHPGVLSTSIPVVSSSSGYSSLHSPSRPCQDDCMRPVRRLPVSDLPWLGEKSERRLSRRETLSKCCHVKSFLGGKEKVKNFNNTHSVAGTCFDICKTFYPPCTLEVVPEYTAWKIKGLILCKTSFTIVR